ncbi:MAG: Eco57I restriction-modification methylase domain-containing protein, partial [Leptospiraceae bacterium]|nr:Eco57I restriction-modification methylase domain-containing protein [Leptospiraceae bacterium]
MDFLKQFSKSINNNPILIQFFSKKAKGEKVEGSKYYKREEKSDGTYRYFYTVEQYQEAKEKEYKEKRKKGLFDSFKNLFGIQEEKEVTKKIEKDFSDYKSSNPTLEVTQDHFEKYSFEYFKNKLKIDSFFAGKKKEQTEPKEKVETSPKTPKLAKVKVEDPEKKIKYSVFKFLNSKYSNPETPAASPTEQKKLEKNNFETMPESEYIPKQNWQNNIVATREYAIALGIDFDKRTETRQSIVDKINKFLSGETKEENQEKPNPIIGKKFTTKNGVEFIITGETPTMFERTDTNGGFMPHYPKRYLENSLESGSLQVENKDEILEYWKNVDVIDHFQIKDGVTTPIYENKPGQRIAKINLPEIQEQVKQDQIILNAQKKISKISIKKQHEINEKVRELLETKTDEEMTEEDKELLSKYEGEGGQTTNKENEVINKGLLYEFYTPQPLIDKTWEIIKGYFKPGDNILEPAAGIGKWAKNIQGLNFDMLELDPTSARIAKILYPEQNVKQGRFEEMFLDKNFRSVKEYKGKKYQGVVGNPPYGKFSGMYKGSEGKGWKQFETYFLKRSLDTVEEGGIVAMVVPSRFLDYEKHNKDKLKVMENAELVDAYRFPEGAFSNTKEQTDLVILRKNTTGKQNNEDSFGGRFFQKNPDKIIGEEKTRINTRYGDAREEKFVSGDINQFLDMSVSAPIEMSQDHKDAIAAGLI